MLPESDSLLLFVKQSGNRALGHVAGINQPGSATTGRGVRSTEYEEVERYVALAVSGGLGTVHKWVK